MTPVQAAGRYADTDATPPWAPAAHIPRIGADESGKGDYFGPLVSAAVYVDERAAERLASIGVQDSKRLSDGRVRALAPQVREAVGSHGFKLTQLCPERYNLLYRSFSEQGRNLNHLLAWAHARSIEDVLLMGGAPGCGDRGPVRGRTPHRAPPAGADAREPGRGAAVPASRVGRRGGGGVDPGA
jgi:hypothetical protein